MTIAPPNPQELAIARISEWLALFIDPDQVVELRAIDVKLDNQRPKTHCGFYDGLHLREMAKDATFLSCLCKGVYFTLNPLLPGTLERRKYRCNEAKKGMPADDIDVMCRRWLLVDVDPKRPSSVSSTDSEKAFAFEICNRVREFLTSEGFPSPIYCDSGNGYHLAYRFDPELTNIVDIRDDDSVKRCLLALAERFGTDRVDIDTKVYNASRICKVPGTKACKGPDTKERPHRRAKVLEVPTTSQEE